jgi:hypothetical protein
MSVVATRHADALVEAIRKRLGERLVVRPADVAAACDVSLSTVYAWIEEGVVDAVNIGRGGRACWQVLTTSVVAFYERRKEAM